MKNAFGQQVHRFTNLEAERRELAHRNAEQRRNTKAAEWAAAATDEELHAVFADGDTNPNAAKFARRAAALNELKTRRPMFQAASESAARARKAQA